jgi:mRNA interferase MazF
VRSIYTAQLDKLRPVMILTREAVRASRTLVTVAPITSVIRGLRVEVPVGTKNGLDRDCVVNCDAIQTIKVTDLGEPIGVFFDTQEPALAEAIRAAFSLAPSPTDVL